MDSMKVWVIFEVIVKFCRLIKLFRKNRRVKLILSSVEFDI